MSDSVDRRTVLKGVAASAAAMGPIAEALGAEPDGLQFEAPVPFSYELFKHQARERAHQPYQPPPRPSPEVLAKINYEEWGKIKYRDASPCSPTGRVLPGHLLPPRDCFSRKRSACTWSRATIRARSSTSRRISRCRPIPRRATCPPGRVSPACASRKSRDGPLDWRKNDWVAFLGAAYFRSIGELRQYGLSARGIALDVAVADRPEEFPDFTQFYINSAPDGQT